MIIGELRKGQECNNLEMSHDATVNYQQNYRNWYPWSRHELRYSCAILVRGCMKKHPECLQKKGLRNQKWREYLGGAQLWSAVIFCQKESVAMVRRRLCCDVRETGKVGCINALMQLGHSRCWGAWMRSRAPWVKPGWNQDGYNCMFSRAEFSVSITSIRHGNIDSNRSRTSTWRGEEGNVNEEALPLCSKEFYVAR